MIARRFLWTVVISVLGVLVGVAGILVPRIWPPEPTQVVVPPPVVQVVPPAPAPASPTLPLAASSPVPEQPPGAP